MGELDSLKQRVIEAIDGRRDDLIRIADAIHANPELPLEEFEAAALLTSTLEKSGFAVERGVAGLETAFVATLHGQSGGPVVAFVAEYDALPGLGHACGHNLIAAAAVGAAWGVQPLLPELRGTVQVIGTPAEEGGGGKVIMVDAGVFAGVDAALMIHPSGENLIGRLSLTAYPVCIRFYGKAAHAAGMPEEGINALEALLLTFSGINALRQHLQDDARIHGIVVHGGDAPNIVPDYAEGKFLVRALEPPYAAQVLERVKACAEGAARATGARLEFEVCGPRYDGRLPNPKLVSLFRDNMAVQGVDMKLATGNEPMGSSDIGNVSQVIPAIHPYIAIGPDSLVGHSPEFREAAASPAGHEGMIHGAKALAMTAVDLLAVPEMMIQAKAAFEDQKRMISPSAT
jgi:amidohydrolase